MACDGNTSVSLLLQEFSGRTKKNGDNIPGYVVELYMYIPEAMNMTGEHKAIATLG